MDMAWGPEPADVSSPVIPGFFQSSETISRAAIWSGETDSHRLRSKHIPNHQRPFLSPWAQS